MADTLPYRIWRSGTSALIEVSSTFHNLALQQHTAVFWPVPWTRFNSYPELQCFFSWQFDFSSEQEVADFIADATVSLESAYASLTPAPQATEGE